VEVEDFHQFWFRMLRGRVFSRVTRRVVCFVNSLFGIEDVIFTLVLSEGVVPSKRLFILRGIFTFVKCESK
jgi:hypothetical protein